MPEVKRSYTWAQLARAFGDVALGSGIVTTTEAWKNPHVRACVMANAKAIAALPMTVYKGTERQKNHWLLELMRRPNPMLRLSEYALKVQTVAIRELFGECFWVLERGGSKDPKGNKGPVKAIWVYHPHAVQEVIARQTGELVAWEFTFEHEKFRLDPLEVIHFAHYDPMKHNPKRPSRGTSPLSSALLAVSSDQAATRYNLDFFTRGTTPGTVFITDGELPESDADRFIDKMRARLSGKGHEPIVLSGGEGNAAKWTIVNTGQTARDAEFKEGRGLNRADIGEVFGVPPVVLGNQDAKYDNADAQLLVWWDMTLSGIMADVTSAINLGILNKEPETLCYLDTANVEVLQKRKRERFTAAQALHGSGIPWKTLNETMDLGLPRFPGDDLALVPFTLTPVESLSEPEAEIEDEEEDPEPPANDEEPITVTEPEEEGDRSIRLQPKFFPSDPIRVTKEPLLQMQVRIIPTSRADSDDPIRAILRIILDGNEELKKIARRAHQQAIETGAKQIQDTVKVESILSIDNPRVRKFLAERGNLIVSVNQTTADKLLSSLRDMMDAGATPEDIGEQIRDLYNLRDRQARVIARTEVGSGLSGGRFMQMEEEGIERHEWLCVAGDTRLTGPGVTHLARRWYDGRWVTLRTRNGRVVTVTANHKILTRRGWICAESVVNGDDLVSYEPSIEASAGIVPDVENVPSAVEKIFSAAHEVGAAAGMVSRVVNLDCDGRKSDVDVVNVDGELRDHLQPTRSQSANDELLKLSDIRLTDLLPDGGMRGAPFAGELSRGHAAPVGFGYDECVGVDVVTRACHAYDYTTSTGWMVGNGLVIHNSSRDGRTRESHAAIDGEIVTIGEQFSNGLEYPQDPMGDASETINCRCLTLPTLDERATRLNKDEHWKRAVKNVRPIETALTARLQRYLFNQRTQVLKALADAGIAK